MLSIAAFSHFYGAVLAFIQTFDISPATLLSIYSAVSVVVHTLGAMNAAHAVMKVKSSRAAIAWSISLISLPWVAIPLYWILGKSKFQGYSSTIQAAYKQHEDLVELAYSEILDYKADLPSEFKTIERIADTFTGLPFTTHNAAKLLIDGEETYPRMLAAIAQAKDYILFQTYILHDDDIGRQFKNALIARARKEVTIHLLYDGIGARDLPRRYITELEEHGITVNSFRSSKGLKTRFQLNFRNHRKILIVDGKDAFVGGLNIGDEYRGKDPKLGDWRDTHLQLKGPAVQCLQRTFLSDWYWVTQEVPEVSWKAQVAGKLDQTTFILATGPADKLEACSLFFLNLINHSKERLWIASPYFVPDGSTLNALRLAAIRGVDVRIILPNRPDQWIVYACSFSYYETLQQVGIQLYRYQPGFMHQKVILCDDQIAGVGTVNLDNRSFFLNFEVMTFVVKDNNKPDALAFIQDVEAMLERDFERSRLVDFFKWQRKPFWFKLAARVARLLAPIL
ncbi:MAG: cardiolipin synthase [Phormidesmis sp.]